MKDFDVARKQREDKDRSFVIGGEKFVYRAAVSPESIMDWSEFSSVGDKEEASLAAAKAALLAFEKKLAVPLQPNEAPKSPETIAADDARLAELTANVADKTEALEALKRPENEWLDVIDNTVLAIIEPQFEEAWRRVRGPEMTHPVSLGDLNEVLEWLMTEVVARPTGSASGSSPSQNGTRTESTDDSSSQEEAESTHST